MKDNNIFPEDPTFIGGIFFNLSEVIVRIGAITRN